MNRLSVIMTRTAMALASNHLAAQEQVVAPAEEVFDLGKKERKDTEKKTIEDYVAKVRVDLAVAEGDDIASAVRSLSFAKDVHDLALEYLELGRGSYVSEEV